LVVLSPDGHTSSAHTGHIDLVEWADVAGVPFPFPMPAAATSALWDEIRRIPLAQIQRAPVHERVAHVVRKSAQALERVLQTRSDDARQEPFAIDFGVHLETGREPAWRILRMACLPTESGELSLLIGFPHELSRPQVPCVASPLPPRNS